MDIFKKYEVTKKEYFQAAAEYYRITADIVLLLESGNISPEVQSQIKELENQRAHYSRAMDKYSGTSMEEYKNKELLHYPRLTKQEAKREIRAKEGLSHIETSMLTDAVSWASVAITCPFLVQLVNEDTYSFSKIFLSSFLFFPGLMSLVYFLGTIATYSLTKKASRMGSETLEKKEKFLKRAKIYSWLSVIAVGLAGLLIGTYLVVS